MHRMPVLAPTAPRRVPLILDLPMRTRVSTGTSTVSRPCCIALTCISTVQPKRVSAIFRAAKALKRMARYGPRSVTRCPHRRRIKAQMIRLPSAGAADVQVAIG